MNHATLRVWDETACLRVHEASLRLLAGTGVDMKHRRARELCRGGGAAVDGRRVRFPEVLVEHALAGAPRSWQLRPRGGDTAPLELAPGNTYFGTGPDCLYVTDPRSGSQFAGVGVLHVDARTGEQPQRGLVDATAGGFVPDTERGVIH